MKVGLRMKAFEKTSFPRNARKEFILAPICVIINEGF